MQKYAIVSTDLLNLRAGPSTTAQIVSELKNGTVLDVMADPGLDWLQVSVDGAATQGFVAKQYVTLTDTKPGPAAPAAAGDGTTVPSGAAPVTPGGAPTTPTTTPAAPPPTPIGKGEVTTTSLNVRSGPATSFPILTTVTQGAVLNIYENSGGWLKVRVGTDDGYVSAEFVNLNTTKAPSGYLIEQSDLLSAKLTPDSPIPDQTPATSEAVVARTWNAYGGLLNKLASNLQCPLAGTVAVLSAESGGNCFGPDGRLIIRLEVHIFWQYWGQNHPDVFNQYFSFDHNTGWQGHVFRQDANSTFQPFHGNQSSEWQALTIARALDDTSALMSISMGAPQIMGFNFRRVGYDSVQSMFYQFTHSAQAQLLGLFDFVRGTNADGPAIQALRSGDYVTFARLYNGSGNAQTYANIISNYVTIAKKLIPSA